jgi:hypothetical protein
MRFFRLRTRRDAVVSLLSALMVAALVIGVDGPGARTRRGA